MAARAGSSTLPAQGMPSREDFLKLDERQREQINEAFAVFDVDKDGRIDYNEFRFTLRALGFDLPKPETYQYLVRYGLEPVGWDHERRGDCAPVWREFNLPVLQGIAGTLVANRDPLEESRRVFKLFDKDGKGMISVDDLRGMAAKIGQPLDDAQLKRMIHEFDTDGKGGVNEDEFVRVMTMNTKNRK